MISYPNSDIGNLKTDFPLNFDSRKEKENLVDYPRLLFSINKSCSIGRLFTTYFHHCDV